MPNVQALAYFVTICFKNADECAVFLRRST